MKILIVEDDPIQRSTLKRALQKLDCKVIVEAVDGVSGIEEFLLNHDLDFVITDYQMPHLNGVQMVERMREKGSKVPVVLLTGMESKAVHSRAIQAGADAAIEKPFGYHDLVAAIATVMMDLGVGDRHSPLLSMA